MCTSAHFRPDLATPATSLDLEAGRRISRQTLLVALLKSLEREALALADPAAAKEIPARVEAGFYLGPRPQRLRCTGRRHARA